ncbi:ricin B lectin domain-containing protein [Mycena leptocephala]|nr:ricin B lectin domain-containing protein [Mycena leptocephala]
MFSSTVVALAGFALSTAARQIQSVNSGFYTAGIQGCIAVAENADGEPLIIHNCNTESDLTDQDWEVAFFTRENAGPQQISVFGDKCIDVTGGVNADGTKLQIWTCTEGNTNQQWISVSDFTFQWSGTNKRIDLRDGKITDGNQLQIWTCDDRNANQHWIGAPNPGSRKFLNLIGGIVSVAVGPFCITAASNTDGAEVALAECLNGNPPFFSAGNSSWTAPVDPLIGQIKRFDNKCLDVPNGSLVNGVKLQIWTCAAGNTNQQWKIHSGPSQIEWNGTGKCLDLTDDLSTNGNPLWDCAVPDNNPNQDWSRGSWMSRTPCVHGTGN